MVCYKLPACSTLKTWLCRRDWPYGQSGESTPVWMMNFTSAPSTGTKDLRRQLPSKAVWQLERTAGRRCPKKNIHGTCILSPKCWHNSRWGWYQEPLKQFLASLYIYIYIHMMICMPASSLWCFSVMLFFCLLGKIYHLDISGSFCKVAALCEDWMLRSLKSSQINSTNIHWSIIY